MAIKIKTHIWNTPQKAIDTTIHYIFFNQLCFFFLSLYFIIWQENIIMSIMLVLLTLANALITYSHGKHKKKQNTTTHM